MTSEPTQHNELAAWSNRHAVLLLLVSVAMGLFSLSIEPLVLFASISFAVLLLRIRASFPLKQFGLANTVTLFRLCLLMILALTGIGRPATTIILALTIFCLDGVDGWLARKFGTASEFGEYFDKETDAFFILALCWLIVLDERLGAWILLPGLMRYGFVCFLMLAKPPAYKETQTAAGKWIFAVTLMVLITCFTDYASIYRPLALAMTGLLCYSFADSIRLIYRSDDDDKQA